MKNEQYICDRCKSAIEWAKERMEATKEPEF